MFRSKEKKQEKQKSRVERRVDSMPSSELLPWTEQLTYSVGRNLSSWQKTNDLFFLDEARTAAEALYVITDTLARRNQSVKL
jgi:hypothetical protein